MYLRIFDPIKNKWNKINSKNGKTILKNYLSYLHIGGSIRDKPKSDKLTQKYNWRKKMSIKNYNSSIKNKNAKLNVKDILKFDVNKPKSPSMSNARYNLIKKLHKEGVNNQHCAYSGLPVLPKDFAEVNGYLVHYNNVGLMKTCSRKLKKNCDSKTKPYLTKLPGSKANLDMPDNYENFCCVTDPTYVSDIVSEYISNKRSYNENKIPLPAKSLGIREKSNVYSLVNKQINKNYSIQKGSHGTVLGISKMDLLDPEFNYKLLIEWNASSNGKIKPKLKKIPMYTHLKLITNNKLDDPTSSKTKSCYDKLFL